MIRVGKKGKCTKGLDVYTANRIYVKWNAQGEQINNAK